MKVDKHGNTRESFKMTPAQFEALAQIAAATGSVTKFAKAGQITPSWRTLIKRIADGELVVMAAGEAL